MAAWDPGDISLTTGAAGGNPFGKLLPTYWDQVLGSNLYPSLYMYQFGTKRTVPRNFGKTIKIPRFRKGAITGSVTEGTVISTRSISADFISGTMAQFGGAYAHSDIFTFTAMSDIIELSIRDIARDMAKTIDTYVRNQLSAGGTYIYGNDATSSATIGTADILKPIDIIQAVVTLDSADNPRPPDNHYPTIIHPKTVYDIQTNLSGGAWLDVVKYTDTGINRAYLGEVGRLYGARFITSSNVKRFSAGLSVATVSAAREFMFAPDAYYITEINDLTASTYVHGLGSAGAADPINQLATVGVKVFLGVLTANWTATETRYLKLFHAQTL